MNKFPVGLRDGSGPNGPRMSLASIGPSLALALAMGLLLDRAAWADCTPQAADNVTATCTGATFNQGGGAPGTNAGTNGYGTGVEIGVTVSVAAGIANLVSGTDFGIFVASGTVGNNANASIGGSLSGIRANGGSLNLTNSGTISGIAGASDGAFALANATVINNAGATISGGARGVVAIGTADVINAGTITGIATYGIYAGTSATVTNNSAAATISGGQFGIYSAGTANVTNAGSLTGTSDSGIFAQIEAAVTNNTAASITGGQYGVYANAADVTNAGNITGGLSGIRAAGGSLNLTNSGTISGTAGASDGAFALANATVTNTAGATISGGTRGVVAIGTADVINAGTITGTSTYGIYAGTSATVMSNSAAATITGGQSAIHSAGTANVTNAGSLTGTSDSGIFAQIKATVTNNTAASITGGQYGVYANAADVTNAGNITGGLSGIRAAGGSLNLTNSGTISGTAGASDGAFALSNATVTNTAGATISGGARGVVAIGAADVTNAGTITGIATYGIYAGTSATVTNMTGASITGGTIGILAVAAGGSSIFNAGSISGGTAIQFAGAGNTLTLAPGSSISGNVLGTGNDTFQLGGSGAASFDVSQIGAAAQYQGFGTFNKIGNSTWTLTGTSTFAGPVNVNGGTLGVDGDLTSASNLTVTAGATLGGNGIVGNTTIDGGTLSPGHSIGLLSVQGNLVFTAAASYLVEVSASSADRVNVTGTATLGGATVNAAILDANVAKQYLILSATGIVGTFNPVVSTNQPNFTGSLSYVGNDVYLNLALNFASATGLNVNQQNVANALTNSFNATGSIPLAFGSLTPSGLTQASGETVTGAQQTTFTAMNLFLGLITDPFIGGRSDATAAGPGPSAFAEESYAANASMGRARSRAERDAYAAVHHKAPLAPVYQPQWSVWSAGFGGAQTTDGNMALGSNDTTSRIAAGAVGVDYRFSPATIAGFALAGGGTSFSVANGGSGRSDLFQAGAFVRHTAGPAYIAAAAAYGWQDITTDRFVTAAGLDHLRAQFNANAYSGRAEGGYRFVTPWMGLTPYAAGQFTTFDLPAYAESAVTGTNTFALGYAAKSVTASRSELGLRTDKSFATADGIATLRGRLAWAHDFNPDRAIGATFQALPGASFVVNGAAQASDAALVTASAEKKWLTGWSAAATFEGEFSNVTRSYAGKGVVRYQW
ncbi:autotransporter domain-containing protein [Bradyrhizobium cajani]|nr:autotransporter domain-containing protein [Bradyrhizobium cajani]